MPIASGARGSPGILGIPGKKIGRTKPFRSVVGINNTSLTGVSRDSTGAALGACRVMIFRTEDNSFVMETTSDASGNWSVTLNKGGPFFLVEYKAGAPDVAGTSVNMLTVV